MQLRPYQTDIIARTEAALKAEGSAVMQMPTGGGKTRIAAEIVSKADGPVWFICHRQEIERQAAAAFARAGIDFGIISPRGTPQYEKRVQIVSVGALPNKIDDLPAPKLAIWDECHHVAAKSWAVIREQLSSTVHLGLTATPERFDGKGLGEWFSALVTGPSTRELIDGGYLSEFRYFAPSDPDLTAAKLQAGDYKKGDAAKVMNTPVLIGDAIAEYKAKASGKRALIFAASIDASKAIVERFNAEGIVAAHVDGTTPTDQRDATVADLAAGRVKVLSNVEVFTEGFDLPAIDAVILMRPTKSVTLFLQMIGRALRKADGKDEALIFDHAGLWLDHGWFDSPWDWSIDGGVKKRRLAACAEGRLRRCPSCKEVREERVEACRCGYEFPTGRELGEYDGQLVEMRGAVSIVQFSSHWNLSRKAVYRAIRDGLPVKDGKVLVIEGNAWISDKVNNYKTKNKPDGWDYIENVARSLGTCSPSTIKRWGSSGKIKLHNGFVNIDEVSEYSRLNMSKKFNSYRLDDKKITMTDFAKKIGMTAGSICMFIEKGMPATEDKMIDLDAAITWLKENPPIKTPPMFCDNPDEFEISSSFCKRVNVALSSVIKFRKKGIPCAPNGWVHIQRGLEWVRENTDIKIPPEAWPSANDNHQAKEEAA